MDKGKPGTSSGGRAKSIIAELHAQDEKARNGSNLGAALLVVALPRQLLAIGPKPEALQDLEKAIRDGGLPLGFILIIAGANDTYHLRTARLPERANDETARSLLDSMGQHVADQFERDTGAYVGRTKERNL